MERPERVAQLYGYSVCLIAIVVMLVSISSAVDRLFTLSDPLAAGGGSFGWAGGPVLTSFEAYKATVDRVRAPVPISGRDSSAARPTEAELRTRYEALRADQLARSRLEARRDLTSSTILLLIAAALFWSHWRWLRRSVVPLHSNA
jgi:hypothetical protein